VLRFAADVEGVGGLDLHAVGQFEGLDAGLDGRLARAFGEVAVIELAQQRELPRLCVVVEMSVAQVRDELARILLRRSHQRALVNAGQEGGAPVVGAAHREPAGAQCDEARRIPVLRTHAPVQPRAEARPHQPLVARVHQHERHRMAGQLGVHGPDHGQLVGTPGQVGETGR